jgi:hypothetical protein
MLRIISLLVAKVSILRDSIFKQHIAVVDLVFTWLAATVLAFGLGNNRLHTFHAEGCTSVMALAFRSFADRDGLSQSSQFRTFMV